MKRLLWSCSGGSSERASLRSGRGAAAMYCVKMAASATRATFALSLVPAKHVTLLAPAAPLKSELRPTLGHMNEPGLCVSASAALTQRELRWARQSKVASGCALPPLAGRAIRSAAVAGHVEPNRARRASVSCGAARQPLNTLGCGDGC